ncbi:hypothetical protein Droror1_Dr00026437 [Drosera rotundifolia]
MANRCDHLIKFGCLALLLLAMIVPPHAKAAILTFNPNPLYYCRDCIANGDKASSLSWVTCCLNLKDVGEKLSTAGAKLIDKHIGCVGMRQYASELPGYSFNNAQHMLDRCKAKYPFAISATSNCSSLK